MCTVISHPMGRLPWDSHRNDIPIDKPGNSSGHTDSNATQCNAWVTKHCQRSFNRKHAYPSSHHAHTAHVKLPRPKSSKRHYYVWNALNINLNLIPKSWSLVLLNFLLRSKPGVGRWQHWTSDFRTDYKEHCGGRGIDICRMTNKSCVLKLRVRQAPSQPNQKLTVKFKKPVEKICQHKRYKQGISKPVISPCNKGLNGPCSERRIVRWEDGGHVIGTDAGKYFT